MLIRLRAFGVMVGEACARLDSVAGKFKEKDAGASTPRPSPVERVLETKLGLPEQRCVRAAQAVNRAWKSFVSLSSLPLKAGSRIETPTYLICSPATRWALASMLVVSFCLVSSLT